MDAPLKILIVDDEEELVTTLVERLEIRGFKAIGVYTGTEAIEQIKTQSFDVVIQDVKLKGEDGIEVMKLIKQIKQDLPVILLTGHMSPETNEEGLKAGAIDFILKPVSIENLIAKMKEAVSLY